MSRLIVLLFAFTLCFGKIKGQIVQNQFWADYNQSNVLKSGHILFGDVGLRFLDVGNEHEIRFNLRPGIRFRTNRKVSFQAGLGYFYFRNEIGLNAHEVRLFGGMQFEGIKIGPSKLNHLIRFEAIQFWFQDNFNFPNIQMRFRYEIGEDIQLSWFNVNAANWYLPIALEPFINLAFRGDDFQWISRLRITAGLGYSFGNDDALEICYIYQETGVVIERNINVTNHAIRLRYYHKGN